MKGTLHVVGAGLAGLSAAVAAASAGTRVVLHEAAGHAGGRCRSFRDDSIGRVIDNGTHLLLGVNQTALAYAARIGGTVAMERHPPAFPFLDLQSGDRWTLSAGRLLLRPFELLAALGVFENDEAQTVAMRLSSARSFRRIWEPLCVAALNTDADQASAQMFARLLRAALTGGVRALDAYEFPAGLSSALVAPALATLAAHGTKLCFRHRLTSLDADRLVFDHGPLPLAAEDRVILALPPWITGPLLDQSFALPTRAIVGAHFVLGTPGLRLPGNKPFLGLTGGTAQWLAQRGDVISVTVSAADALAARPNAEIASLLWREIAPVLGMEGAPPPRSRIIKERRATLAHTPTDIRARPTPATRFPKIVMAGDWMDGPWPCTIEAAIRSGLAAARLALARPELEFQGPRAYL